LDYQLPLELIAQKPTDRRDDSRLLIVDRSPQALRDERFRDIAQFLRPGDLLVLNNTKVLPAKIEARRPTGGRLRGLFVRESSQGEWEVLLTGASKLRVGERLQLSAQEHRGESNDAIELLERLDGGKWRVRLLSESGTEAVLDRVGKTPLPPYIRRERDVDEFDEFDAIDRERYQAVYAAKPGAVAAPTAGLHFTPELLDSMADRGIETAQVTLHVGMGTFAPISVERLDDHVMHEEWYEMPEGVVESIREARKRGGRVVAVGSTSARVLETCSRHGEATAGSGMTNLFIRPPYAFRVVDVLITNFHLPKSTLMAMVMAFAGVDRTRRAYRHAVQQRYRFFSYGDAMLIV
jgi:S-adenosylmethionine:tRNA ribosyltransferase-isomerase